eukprot:TRINITY_DN7078_c0_g1_i1.p1 TRINITY_DN7078_c0_g1~~TRINITY_DN7078_c0_g1_i1.p1  ORF type:complete len:102 (+),score=27.66 TRINITY_DN7078_c0_g1_i1:58-363(+)
MAYRFIYNTFFYRNSTYLISVVALAAAYEEVNRNLAFKFWTYTNEGKSQWQLRRSVTDARTAEGEKSTWNLSIHTSVPSPNGDNLELQTGEPRYPLTNPGH